MNGIYHNDDGSVKLPSYGEALEELVNEFVGRDTIDYELRCVDIDKLERVLYNFYEDKCVAVILGELISNYKDIDVIIDDYVNDEV